MPHETLPATFILIAMTIALTSCSKSSVNVDRESPQQITLSATHQSTMERVAEIDRLLAAPLTGTPEDSDRRVALRAERNALVGHRMIVTNQSSDPTQKARADAQAAREHQQTIDKLKMDAERSRMAEQRQLQAQRDQWDKEDRLSLRRQNGDFRPEAPPQNTYDIQVRNQRSRAIQPVYP